MHETLARDFLEVLDLEAKALRSAHSRLGTPEAADSLRKTFELLNRCLDKNGKIVVTGIGKSGKIAQKIAATLTSTGSLAVFLHPTEALHGDLGVIRENDALIALSYTGNSEEVVRLAEAVRSRVAGIVILTNRKDSRLGEFASHWIDCSVEQEACPHNLAPTASTTLMLAIGDALAVALMKHRKFEPGDFARNHPGGALGKKLTLVVRDLMHAGSKLGIVSPHAKTPEVIEISTQKKLGGVIVAEGDRLAGLITDGDIRRALSNPSEFFNFTAAQIMTKHPITVSPETLAKDALALMENRSSQISVLPVVDPDGKPLGMIRLHDLVRTL
jgi:arabinose-5-phosphate isomerase